MTYSIRILVLCQFLLIGLIIIATPSFGTSLDSLRTEEISGKLFIIHQVDPGETLYALSRRYKVSVPDIIAHNESVELDLAVGAIIKIPLANLAVKIDTVGLTKHEVNAQETLFSLSKQYNITIDELKSTNNLVRNELSIGQVLFIKPSKEVVDPVREKVDIPGQVTHELLQGETLYGLSKQYGVSLDQLREWNNLEENNLSIGQLLVVGIEDAQGSVTPERIDIKPDTIINSVQEPDTIETSKQVKNINGFDEIVETGIGEMIPGSTEAIKYLGLHRSAKVGTIMKVKNEMNNKMVFVRIIGRIPNTGNNKKVMIKITKAAYDRLGIIDPRFRAEVSYMP